MKKAVYSGATATTLSTPLAIGVNPKDPATAKADAPALLAIAQGTVGAGMGLC